MSEGIEILSREKITYRETFLSSRFETGIVAFALRAEFENRFEDIGRTINRKSVVIGNSNPFKTAAMFFTIEPIYVITRTRSGFRLTNGTREFLSGTVTVMRFTVTVHSETGITDNITERQAFRIFSITEIGRNVSVTVIEVANSVVDILDVIG